MNNYRHTDAIIIPVENSESSNSDEELSDGTCELNNEAPAGIDYNLQLEYIQKRGSTTNCSQSLTSLSLKRRGKITLASTPPITIAGSRENINAETATTRKKRRRKRKRKFRIPGSNGPRNSSKGDDSNSHSSSGSGHGEESQMNSAVPKARMRVRSAPITKVDDKWLNRETRKLKVCKQDHNFRKYNRGLPVHLQTSQSMQNLKALENSKHLTLGNERIINGHCIESNARLTNTVKQQNKNNDVIGIKTDVADSKIAISAANELKQSQSSLRYSNKSHSTIINGGAGSQPRSSGTVQTPPSVKLSAANTVESKSSGNNLNNIRSNFSSISTAVAQYANGPFHRNNSIILHREIVNPRHIPIMATVDNKFQGPSALYSNVGNFDIDLKKAASLEKTFQPKSILKANDMDSETIVSTKSIDRKKSVRFSKINE